ncbi:hypothetical protein FQN50_000610 [Emmonsiellopsis sp. PD_5]|nr:hypothetical protein FQN50_000610 [Emmonsiellopsis sp. PD_5]
MPPRNRHGNSTSGGITRRRPLSDIPEDETLPKTPSPEGSTVSPLGSEDEGPGSGTVSPMQDTEGPPAQQQQQPPPQQSQCQQMPAYNTPIQQGQRQQQPNQYTQGLGYHPLQQQRDSLHRPNQYTANQNPDMQSSRRSSTYSSPSAQGAANTPRQLGSHENPYASTNTEPSEPTEPTNSSNPVQGYLNRREARHKARESCQPR